MKRTPHRPLLVTGFEPFDGEPVNPSWLVAEAVHGRRIGGAPVVAVLLPCAFGAALTRPHPPARRAGRTPTPTGAGAWGRPAGAANCRSSAMVSPVPAHPAACARQTTHEKADSRSQLQRTANERKSLGANAFRAEPSLLQLCILTGTQSLRMSCPINSSARAQRMQVPGKLAHRRYPRPAAACKHHA